MQDHKRTPQRKTDEHKFPFSLLSTNKLGQDGLQVTKMGDVSEQMDKSIGRPVYRIKGAISANNFIEIDQVQLVGPFMYVQLCLLSPVIATFHLEVVTTANVCLRLSISTMYDGEQPRFMGRSLRLPLPKVTGWMVLVLDLNQIIGRYCANAPANMTTKLGLQSVKKLQICSNMILRDVVTSDRLYTNDPMHIPKELSVKPCGAKDVPVVWVDLLNHCGQDIVTATTISTPTRHSDASSSKASRLQRNSHLLKSSPQSDPSASPLIASVLQRRRAVDVADAVPVESPSRSSSSKTSNEPHTSKQRHRAEALTTDDLAATSSVVVHSDTVHTNEVKNDQAFVTEKHSVDFKVKPEITKTSNRFGSSNVRSVLDRVTQSVSMSTPRRVSGRAGDAVNQLGGSSPVGGGVMRHFAPETSPADRLLSMERLLGYGGGPSVLLYDGRMLVLSTGPLLVLVDLVKQSSSHAPTNGLWKAFKMGDSEGERHTDGHPQSILRGHGRPIALLEVSDKENFMASSEVSSSASLKQSSPSLPGPLLILWDLVEGRRLVSLRPHAESILSVAFSPDCAMLVTAGTDTLYRHQIIVWDLQQLLLEKTVVIGYNNSSAALIIARQISEFHISSIRFSPFEDFSLVSCGRENIRFWRIRKGHLPGRPVLLNEYSRGFVFGQMAFNMDSVSVGGAGDDPSLVVITKRPTVYVSCNKGMLLRVNCATTQVLCAFQLHSSPIRSLCIRFGYAVTGGDDHMLRVWPLDFVDFLLEAQHEGAITSIRVSTDGRSQAIGTAAGTLGILNVSDHSYNTVLRSHVGPISRLSSRGSNWFEFATLGRLDHTVRVWDALSATQVIEFDCEQDEPTALCYHPSDHFMVCGFASGFMRLFDVTSAAVICQRKSHNAPITTLRYLSPIQDVQLLISAGLDGALVVYSVLESYLVIRTIVVIQSALSVPLVTMTMVVSEDQSLVALASSTVASIVVLETQEFTVSTRLSPIHQGGSPAPFAAGASDTSQQNGTPTTPLPASTHVGAGLHSGSSHFAATAIFSATAGTPGGEAGGSVGAAVVGMFFLHATNATNALVVVTEKHLITLPMTTERVAGEVTGRLVTRLHKGGAWESRSSRRIDFGKPTRVVVDSHSSLVFMAVHAPVASTKKSSGPQLTERLDETANSLVVMSMQLTSGTFGPRLSVSPVQLYRDLPSAVQDICPCLHCGKVVTVDDSGCIVLWDVRSENIDKFTHPLLYSRAGSSPSFENRDQEQQGREDVDVYLGDEMVLNVDSSESLHTPCAKGSQPEEEPSAVAFLTKDFEQAARHDPAMWSTTSEAAKSLMTESPRERADSTRFSSLYEWEEATPGPGSSVQKAVLDVSDYEEQDVQETKMDEEQLLRDVIFDEEATSTTSSLLLVAPKKSLTEAHIRHRRPENSWKVPDREPASSNQPPVHANYANYDVNGETLAMNFREWVNMFTPAQFDSAQLVAGECAVEAAALGHRNAFAPSINCNKGVILTSDGASILVTHLGPTIKQLALRVPTYLTQFEHCEVICCTLSSEGDCIAAIARVLSNGSQDVSAAHCLMVWRLEGHISLSSSQEECSWVMAGLAELGTSEHTHRPGVKDHKQALLDWTADGALVVIVSLPVSGGQSRRIEDALHLSVVTRSAIAAGLVREAVLESSCSVACPVASGMSHFKVLPRTTGEQKLSLMVTSMAKLLFITMSTRSPDNRYVARVLWSEDVGHRGPFLGLGVAAGDSSVLSSLSTASRKHFSQEINRRVVALLDACGSVRFVEVFWGDDAVETPQLPPRVVSVSIAAANASGALQSLAFTHSSHSQQLQLVLGAAHTIRVFAVQIRDLNARSIAAQVTLITKVSSDFRSDFCYFVRQPHEKSRGTSLRLIVTCSDGHLGFTRAAPIPSDKAHVELVSVRSNLPTESVVGNSVTDLLVSRDTHSIIMKDSGGHLSCYHLDFSLKKVVGHTVSWRATTLCESFGSFLAVGTHCGKVLLLDTLSMVPAHTVELTLPLSSVAASVSASVNSSIGSLRDGLKLKQRAHQVGATTIPNTAITSISSLVSGSALLLAQHNGDLSLVQLYPGQSHPPVAAKILPSFDFCGPFAASESLRNDAQATTVVASCFGDIYMCGAVRKGSNVLELHRTDHNEGQNDHTANFSFAADASSRRKSYWNNVLNLSLKTEFGDLRVTACHLVFRGHLLHIYVVGDDVDGDSVRSVGLYCGLLQVPTSAPLSHSDTVSPLRVVLTRHRSTALFTAAPSTAVGVASHHFLGGLVTMVHSTTRVVEVWDLIGKGGEGNDEIGHDESKLLFSAPISQLTFGPASGWDGVVVRLFEQPDGEQETRKLMVYRNKNPALFVFDF